MKYRNFITLFCLFGLVISDGLAGGNFDVIQGASYAIEKINEPLVPLIIRELFGDRTQPVKCKTVFYTFDGNPLQEFPGSMEYAEIYKKLDPSAANPQPVKFKIRWRTFIIKGVSGYFIYFYDKNGNEIESSRCKGLNSVTSEPLKKYETEHSVFAREDGTRIYRKDLDLSIAKNSSWSWVNPLTWLGYTHSYVWGALVTKLFFNP